MIDTLTIAHDRSRHAVYTTIAVAVLCLAPTHDVGPRTQCISGLNPAAYGLPVNASRPGSPQAHASLGSGWRPTLAGWDWIPTGF